MIYGYCRVSTKTQKLERQIENINKYVAERYNTSAKLYTEKYTGTKVDGRAELNNLLNVVAEGDTIIFDEVSRMSRNAEQGFELYKTLYDKGINLVFLKEHHIDTDTFKQAVSNSIPMTNTDVDVILQGINQYLMLVAKKQIQLAFEKARSERDLLALRTTEGLQKAKDNNGGIAPTSTNRPNKYNTDKGARVKDIIIKYSVNFKGTMSDAEILAMCTDISKATYYRYKKRLSNK